MIVTLTPNPSIDRTYALDELRRGEVHRSSSDWIEAGGKGINVVRVLAANGVPARPVLPVGGPTGDSVVKLLADEGIAVAAVPIMRDLRCNITLTQPDGQVTKVNAIGPVLADAEIDALVERSATVVEEAHRAHRARAGEPSAWFVSCGSLTPGAPEDLFSRVIARIRSGPAAEVRVAVDTSGPALAATLAARPDVIKPNLSELEELCARPLPTLGDVAEAAHDLATSTVGTVLVSLGEVGALAVTADVTLHAWSPAVPVLTTVGAGDAMLAGYLSHAHLGVAEALRHAVAYGAAAVQRPIGAVAGPGAIDVPAVTITEGFQPSSASRRGRPIPTAGAGATEVAASGRDRDALRMGERE